MNKRNRAWLARTNGLPAPKRISVMPSRDQVAFHNALQDELRRREMERQQQAQAQGYGYQLARDAQQHAYGMEQAQQQAQLQYGAASALSQQQFGQQQQLATQHVDLQARLHQVQLNDEEVMRVRKMERARARIEDDPTLAPYERHQLITQIESGLNPLENRQREAQMLQSHLQSQGLSQQNEQQATLFNQRQERLQAGIGGRMQVATDPLTGRQQLFQMDLNGEMHPLDFSQAQQHHEMQMQQMQTQIEGQQQQQQQSAQSFPGQMQRQDLGNQQLAQTLRFAREIHPLDVQRAQQANQLMAQQIEQNPQTFNLNQLQGYAHVAGLQQQLQERIQSQPHNLNLLAANAQIAQARAAAEPTNTALQQQAHRATIAHNEAATAHTNAIVERMPSVQESQAQHGAQSQHAQDTAAIARMTLDRMLAGGLPDSVARDVTDHAIAGVDREIAHAEQEVQHALPGADQDAARERLRLLRSDRGVAITRRANEAEDLMRRITGAPAANRPQPAAPPPQQNDQANAIFQGIEQQAAALPPAQRQAVAPAVARLQAIRQAYPGGFNTMPAATQREVMELIQRVRGAVPAGAPAGGQRPPPPPWWDRGIFHGG